MAQNPFSNPDFGTDLTSSSEAGSNPFSDPSFGAAPKRRTLAAIANDTVIEVANAAAGGVSSAANFIRPGNSVSGWIDKNIVQAGEASQSDAVKAEKQRFQQDVANADGVMGELGAVGRYVVGNPVLAAAQAVGSFAGPGAAVKGGRTLASIAGLNAARGGLAGGAAAGAAMAGGDAAGTAYELSTKGGATDEQAVAAGRQASVIPAVIGGVGGVVGAERLVAGAKGFSGNALSRAAKTAAVEGAQEGIEEGVTQYEGQRAAMPYDKTLDPMKGVAAAAGMGAALGAATGGGVSLLTGGHSAERAPVERAQIDPNRLSNEDVATYSQYIESGLKPENQQQYRQMLAMAQDPSVPEQARSAAARDLHAAFAPETMIQAQGAESADASQGVAQPAAPAIDPNAGPLSKAASLAGDLGLAPTPAAPTAQEQRATLEAAISRLPDAQQREARLNLADLDNQSLPTGVRAMRDARLQELVSGAPAAPVDLTPQDMERGRVVQNFDARQPDLPAVADYAPLIEQAIAPEYRAEYQRLLDTAKDQKLPLAERDAAVEVLHATFSPDQLQRARTARPTPDTRLELQDTNPARYDNAIDFTPTALTSLGFIFHLGLSPASAMVNLTQTALVAYPVMGAKWGFKKASAALLKASGEAARGKNDITGSLSVEEKAAFDEAVRSGVIDVTMAHDLAGIAQGEDQNVSYKLRPVMRAASWMFHHAEKFNRQITFVAAYRLAREAGAGDKAAFEQAVQATYDGHFDYSSNNRPRAMQGNVARVVLLFKQYGQNMVYTLVRNAQQSLKGATPAERAQARRALGGLLTMHGLAAGALGLPMVTTLLAAASMLGGDDDEPWDAQVALQNMLADTFGQKPAEVLAHGVSRLTPFDISGRVGLDKLIFPDVQEGLEGQRLAESAMTAALGPVAGIGINVLKGMQEMGEGRYQRGLEAMAPSVLRGPLKSFRYGTEGVQDKSGIVVQDEVGAAELLGQASGFSPSSVRNAYEGKSAVVKQDRALQARRSALVEQFAMAAMAGDEEGKAAAREDITKFNEKNPNRRIQPMQLAQSVNMRQKRIRDAQDGVYLPSKRRADAMEAGRFAVPD